MIIIISITLAIFLTRATITREGYVISNYKLVGGYIPLIFLSSFVYGGAFVKAELPKENPHIAVIFFIIYLAALFFVLKWQIRIYRSQIRIEDNYVHLRTPDGKTFEGQASKIQNVYYTSKKDSDGDTSYFLMFEVEDEKLAFPTCITERDEMFKELRLGHELIDNIKKVGKPAKKNGGIIFLFVLSAVFIHNILSAVNIFLQPAG